MHDHLDEGNGADADVLEVVGVFLPWSRVEEGFVGGWVEGVESVTLRVEDGDGVLSLCVSRTRSVMVLGEIQSAWMSSTEQGGWLGRGC